MKVEAASARKILTEQMEEAESTLKNQQVVNDKAIKKQGGEYQAFLAAEQTKRDRLRSQKERFAAILIPLAMAAAALWIGLLAYGNARRRQSEIGILRAIGLRTSQVLTLLLGKAFYLGLLGAVLGVGTGLVAGMVVCEINWGQVQARQLIQPSNLWIAAGMAPLIAMVGSILPAMVAAQRDPASVLQEE